MLKVLRLGDAYQEPCALLLGGFDGLHLGHLKLLEAAKATQLPVGITAISGAKTGGDLFTLEEREYLFERMGIAFVLELPFSEAVKNTSAEEFLRSVFAAVCVHEVFCGEDVRFGRNAIGTPETLKRSANCPVTVLKTVQSGGEKIATSLCKSALAAGDMQRLNALLASPYFVQGTVEHGRQVGRTYGFPTLNLSVSTEKLLPKDGVYGGYAETPAGRYPTIINIGARPTFGVEEKKVEAYLKGFSGDLYGATVRIYPTQFLRRIQKFDSEEELKNQLKKDIKRLQSNEL